MNSLGKRIKLIRNKEGLNQTEFATKLGSTLGALSRYEIDKVVPSDVFIKLLCEVYNVNESWLRTGEGEIFEEITIDEEFADIYTEAMTRGNEQIKNLMIKISKLDEEQLNAFINFLEVFTKDKK